MWVATQDLPRSAAHSFYARLNQILDQHDFDGFVEGLKPEIATRRQRPAAIIGIEPLTLERRPGEVCRPSSGAERPSCTVRTSAPAFC
jgi:hypothetical protein